MFKNPGVYVVVQFYPWFKFYFVLFLGMVMYDKQKKIKIKPRIKLNRNIYTALKSAVMLVSLNPQ